MGFYSLYDAFQGIMDEWCDFDLFSLDDIDECFSPPEKHFIDLAYIQPIKILGTISSGWSTKQICKQAEAAKQICSRSKRHAITGSENCIEK